MATSSVAWRTAATATQQGEVPESEAKAVTLFERHGEKAELVVRHLGDIPACLADQVLVTIGHQMVGGRSVAKVNVLDDAKVLQRAQGPIDRRRRHFGVLSLDHGGDVLGAQVLMTGPQQHLDGRSSSASRPATLLPKPLHNGLGLVGLHTRSLVALATATGHEGSCRGRCGAGFGPAAPDGDT
jgi:hypothetical protein